MKEHPLFARFYDWISQKMSPVEEPHRREMLEGLGGRVLEVGAGPGVNFPLYGPGARVVAMEPEPNMIRRAAGRAAEAPAPVTLVRAAAERLPFREGAFDAAVLSLVMCSVADPPGVANEVGRVLRPGGEVRIYEHVRSESRRHARWQDRITPVWRRFSAGCHPNRDTAATLQAEGFEVDVRRIPIGPPTPARPHILGAARRR